MNGGIQVDLIRTARAAGRAVLPEPQAKAIVAAAGLRVPAGAVVTELDELFVAAQSLRYPLVLKVVSAGVVHKSDVGGVVANIADADSLTAAWRRIIEEPRLQGIHLDGLLLEECAPSGVELVIGARLDPSFGPTLMLGAGGVFLELVDDVTFRICPVDDADVEEMLQELRLYPRLTGARGTAEVSVSSVVDAARRLSDLMITMQSEVSEIEVNPLIVGTDSAVAADVRIVVRRDEP